ncbi:helix-turn-helix transcriptional regulator [Lactovum miscens]|uniref:Putative transcriptional regulator n=1 Tax=Lactovum miscens TaxID=190387 RepID=A0A841C9K1_9LACT|nr:helix-turn-helix transcriptional regulator [Lactovum miscens]MBB5887870.1 putative transcriptional regulator [Lactovum miscens]
MQNIIRETRKRLSLSQDDLARICHVSRQTINAIENDKYDAELSLAFRLANALESKVDEIFTYENRMRDNDPLWCEKYKCILWQSAGFQNREINQV